MTCAVVVHDCGAKVFEQCMNDTKTIETERVSLLCAVMNLTFVADWYVVGVDWIVVRVLCPICD